MSQTELYKDYFPAPANLKQGGADDRRIIKFSKVVALSEEYG